MMMTRLRRAGLALVLLILVAAPGVGATPATAGRPTDRVPDPHQAGVQYFDATGHTLRGDFLTYWNQYGGLAQFGYPITEEFTEASGPGDQPSLTVQYFERARFEHHPENSDPQFRVL